MSTARLLHAARPVRRTRLAAAAAAAVAVVALVATATQGSWSAAHGADGTWQASYTSGYRSGTSTARPGVLSSVVSISPSKALAAGWTTYSEEEGEYLPAIKSWNGTSWRTWAHQPTIAKPETQPTYQISDIAARSMSDVWIVTTEYPADTIRHWNGKTWTAITKSGLPREWSGTLLLSSTHTWLVGNNFDEDQAFIASYGRHGKHMSWHTARYSRTGSLVAGFVRTKSDAWAVGTTLTYPLGSGRPIIEHWTGSAWHRTPTPEITGTLQAVYADAPDSALAVGFTKTESGTTPIALQWDGQSWFVTSPPDENSTLNAVTKQESRSYWVTGSDPDSPTRTEYFSFSNGTWTTVAGPERAFTDAPGQSTTVLDMAHIAGTSGNWAVGYTSPNDCNGEDDCPADTAGQQLIDRNN